MDENYTYLHVPPPIKIDQKARFVSSWLSQADFMHYYLLIEISKLISSGCISTALKLTSIITCSGLGICPYWKRRDDLRPPSSIYMILSNVINGRDLAITQHSPQDAWRPL